ncbi:MAG: SDR family oxidoreductase [Lactobacillaceae bacterium]|jgi:enoyl-[acyl-carrier protein] reductase I|nr:SDR family oxidoreductase [Lactobacillaceae bacterium]
MKLMEGKKGLIMGLANDKSIAWGIAQALDKAGAQIAISYQGEALEKRVIPLAEQLSFEPTLIQCDVTSSESVKACFDELGKKWGKIDFVVHAIAFSDKNQLKGRTIDTTLENFTNTMHISCFSFLETCKFASDIMNEGGAIVTLTYLGAERVLPNYNIMGVAKAALEASVRYAAVDLGRQNVRVNAISAGPIKTLAASGIGDFRKILRWNELNAPLHKNVTQDEVGTMALALLSPMGLGVTGENLHVDAGYHAIAMLDMENVHETGKMLGE